MKRYFYTLLILLGIALLAYAADYDANKKGNELSTAGTIDLNDYVLMSDPDDLDIVVREQIGQILGTSPDIGTDGVIDHGNIAGLGDDDHGAVYPNIDGESAYTGEHNFDGADTVIRSGTEPPATCTTGELFVDTDEDVNGSLLICRTTNTWKNVDDDGGASRFTEDETTRSTGATDATPDICNGGAAVERLWDSGATGATTITDFDCPGGTLAAGDWFVIIVDNDETTIDFSTGTEIIGNAGVDFTGSDTASEKQAFLFVYDAGGDWVTACCGGMSDPTTLSVDSISAKGAYTALTGNLTVDTDAEINRTYIATANAEIEIADGYCDADADRGTWIRVINDGAYTVAIDVAGTHEITDDGTGYGAGDKVTVDNNAGALCMLECVGTDKWYLTGDVGGCTDGGA